MNEMQASRLIHVADALRDAHADKWNFNMDTYGYDKAMSSGLRDLRGIPKSQHDWAIEHNCGTPACAIGHYAVRDDLQEAFSLDTKGNLLSTETGFQIAHDQQVVMNHFGCSYDEISSLFDGDGCGSAATALEAAVYIERFVQDKGFEIVKDGWV